MTQRAQSAAGASCFAPEQALGERLFQVAEDVYRIPLPTDFPVGDVNTYYLDGSDPVLIDTGVRGERSLAFLEQALAELGRRLADIRTVLLTHVHVDHAGSAQAIRQRSGAAVHLHPRAHRRLRDVPGAFEAGRDWHKRFMARSGFGPATLSKYFSISGLFLPFTESCPELCPVGQSDVFELGSGRRLVAHETGGHTAHDVTFQLEDAKILFSGDHLLPHITSNPTLEAPEPGADDKPRPLLLYQESLPRMAALAAEIACPGHARPFLEVAERCAQLLAHQRSRCDQVLDIVAEAGSVNRKELSLALFGKVPLWEIYLTLSEVQAAVELLESEGKLQQVPGEDADRIELVAAGDSARG